MVKFIFKISVAAGCIIIGYVLAFHYLRCSDKPVNSDAVVLFLGPVTQERIKEARQLLIEEYSKKLIIPSQNLTFPAHHEVFTIKNGRMKENKHFHKTTPINKNRYPGYYQNTHIEVLEAKKMMNGAGYTSALFVSAPYHLRRIRIIASQIFSNESRTLRFVGSRYSEKDDGFSIFNRSNIKQVIIEYYKIAAFYLYHFYEMIFE